MWINFGGLAKRQRQIVRRNLTKWVKSWILQQQARGTGSPIDVKHSQCTDICETHRAVVFMSDGLSVQFSLRPDDLNWFWVTAHCSEMCLRRGHWVVGFVFMWMHEHWLVPFQRRHKEVYINVLMLVYSMCTFICLSICLADTQMAHRGVCVCVCVCSEFSHLYVF